MNRLSSGLLNIYTVKSHRIVDDMSLFLVEPLIFCTLRRTVGIEKFFLMRFSDKAFKTI